ncbi:jg11811 [Pararge aegeria aegeria]|uniref:Jg11811 protein n=1 Tax=Pararge aegeria aegeria TaxID=348720 RepID=A0A8S4SA40_9NEOP|nr:jg11811 [Pararge aegeria aegeria]
MRPFTVSLLYGAGGIRLTRIKLGHPEREAEEMLMVIHEEIVIEIVINWYRATEIEAKVTADQNTVVTTPLLPEGVVRGD